MKKKSYTNYKHIDRGDFVCYSSEFKPYHYYVSYTSPITGKTWHAHLPKSSSIMDEFFFNSFYCKKSTLRSVKQMVKRDAFDITTPKKENEDE